MIKANQMKIGKNVKISPKADILCDVFEVGDGTVIRDVKIQCKICKIGKDCFLWDGVWVQGSFNAGDTECIIGDECLICENARINCNAPVIIGNDVNIGQNVSIWTHASSMDITQRYPWVQQGVYIKDHVWITAGTQILPGIKIDENVIIGNGSIVNKSIPAKSFAAGIPCVTIKKLKPDYIGDEALETYLTETIELYKKLNKNNAEIEIKDKTKIVFEETTVFDCKNKMVKGYSVHAEDFRDFLRYRGIKIFTRRPFESEKPEWAKKAMDSYNNTLISRVVK